MLGRRIRPIRWSLCRVLLGGVAAGWVQNGHDIPLDGPVWQHLEGRDVVAPDNCHTTS